MNNETEYTFKTKTGICKLSPERIVLTREAKTGKVPQFLYGRSIHRGLILYGVFGTIFLLLGVWQIIEEQYISGTLFVLIGIYLFWNVIASWNNSSLNQIERSAVQSIDIQPPKPPLTRGYFTINFTHNGKKQKRLVMMPDAISGGEEEYQKALSMMKETGWL
jgi:hypothetical protein